MVAVNVWRGIPFVAISLLAGLQTIPQSLNEAAAIDGATPWQRFTKVTLPLLTPIIAVVMTFSVLFTFTDFQLIYVLTRGGPVNATHLMATLSFQRDSIIDFFKYFGTFFFYVNQIVNLIGIILRHYSCICIS